MEVKGYPRYLIYDDGRIWSESDNIRWKSRFLNPIVNRQGYFRVGLSNINGLKHFLVSRLVAQHYIPNPLKKRNVDHINGDITNNHISNLRWVSHSENMNNYRKTQINNTSGHRCIRQIKKNNKWIFCKNIYGKRHHKTFKSKTDALCYKYIILLKIKARNKINL